MITKDKVIEFFCIIDEFDKNLTLTKSSPAVRRERRHKASEPPGQDVRKRDNDRLGIRRKIRLRSIIVYLANAAIILWQVTYAAEKARTGFCPDDQPASFCYLATAFSD